MSIIEILLLAFALSMDAFAVSVCKGLATKQLGVKQMCIVGAWFGVFQALMPLIGYYLGAQLEACITAIDHWIAFGLLLLIGANMIREAFSKETNEEKNASFAPLAMLLLAIATSIDALAMGITFAFLSVSIGKASGLIGCTTFVISALGVFIGNRFGAKYKDKASLTGGIILILIGCKVLLEHLGILG